MEAGISICIPTFQRPSLLAQAISSCLRQEYRPLEIVIGDDSPDDRSQAIVKSLELTSTVPILYSRNTSQLGQNANVTSLFSRARHPRLALLHDDDLLVPNALSILDEPWHTFPDLKLAFGDQTIISNEGQVDMEGTKAHNRSHFRRAEERGLVIRPMRAALLLQIPNDGYLIETKLAREVGYRPFSEVGVYCDKDFSLRVAHRLQTNQMFYVNQAVSMYRESDTSISSSVESRRTNHPRAAVSIYEGLSQFNIPDDLTVEKNVLITHMIDKLVKGYAVAGSRREAASLFLSRNYGWRKRLSFRGLYHFALIVNPKLDRLRPYNLKEDTRTLACRNRRL